MPDIDVAALSLAVPPASAPVTTYRPAVSVKNLGISSAVVTGVLQILDTATGLIVAIHTLGPTTLAAGETKNVPSPTDWTLVAGDIGKTFQLFGSVTCPGDMVPANNYLPPHFVTVTAAPPPPVPVEPHAAQHEHNGTDEIDVTNLQGVLASPQTPNLHAAQHESDGADVLSIEGLEGESVTPQPPKGHHASHEAGGSDPVSGVTPGDHAASHQNGGGDEISVAGLSGLLADAQTPLPHSQSHLITGNDKIPGAVFAESEASNAPVVPVPPLSTVAIYSRTFTPYPGTTPQKLLVIATVGLQNDEAGPFIMTGRAYITLGGATQPPAVFDWTGSPTTPTLAWPITVMALATPAQAQITITITIENQSDTATLWPFMQHIIFLPVA